jgi:hypothetical protein
MRRTILALSLFGALAAAPWAQAQTATQSAGFGFSVASNSEVSLAISPTTVDAGKVVTFKADVQPTQGGPSATGYVTFYYGALELGKAEVKNTVATLKLNSGSLPQATYAITAKYSGDTFYQPSVSQPNYFSVVTSTNSQTSLASSPSSVQPGTPVVLKADVQPLQGGPNATGYVLFFAGENGQVYLGFAPVQGTVAQLTIPTANIKAGSYPTYAIYLGDKKYLPSISEPSYVYIQ